MARKIDLEALCHEKGLRITEQRRVIARVLSEAEDHPDVEKVYARASAIDPVPARDRAAASRSGATRPVVSSRSATSWVTGFGEIPAPGGGVG